jgi:hypothetical protein
MMLDVTPHGIDNSTDCPPLYQGVAMLCFTLHLAATAAGTPQQTSMVTAASHPSTRS